jgi:hypothetical protein
MSRCPTLVHHHIDYPIHDVGAGAQTSCYNLATSSSTSSLILAAETTALLRTPQCPFPTQLIPPIGLSNYRLPNPKRRPMKPRREPHTKEKHQQEMSPKSNGFRRTRAHASTLKRHWLAPTCTSARLTSQPASQPASHGELLPPTHS